MRGFWIIGLALLCSLEVVAQSKGKIRFFIDPGHNFEYVLDGKQRLNERDLELTTGQHNFIFWAPTRAMVDTTFVIEEGEQSFYLRLPFSLQFMAHERKAQEFRRKVFLQRSLPAVLTLGAGVWAGVAFGKYKKANDRLVELEEVYNLETIPNEISKLKDSEIPSAKDDFDQRKNQFNLAAGVFAAGLVGSAYAFLKTRNLEPPVFEDKVKVQFDGLVYLPHHNGGTVHAGLTLKWK